MDKPKILVFHHSGAIGGGGVSMLHILESMDRDQYDVTVYCPGEPKHMETMVLSMGMDVVPEFDKAWRFPHYNGGIYKPYDPRYTSAVTYIKQSRGRIQEILERERPDILMLNSVTLVWMAAIAKAMGIKVILFDRETLPTRSDKRTRYIIEAMHQSCDAVAFLTKYDKAYCGYEEDDRGYVVRDRVDANRFDALPTRADARARLGLDPDAQYVLFMGGVWPIKGTHVMVDAMKHTEAHLIFLQYEPEHRRIRLNDRAGMKDKLRYILGMDYEAKIINTIDDYRLWDRIHFAPSQQDVRPWFAACDVVAFPSTLPHQSRPTYEAGFAKRPVVISDFPNTAEYAKDEVNALTFKPHDGEDLARQINRLLEDGELTERLTTSSEQLMREEHDLTTLPAQISTMIENVLGGETA